MAKDPLDRKQILRRDCPTCSGNGYVNSSTGETPCEACGGSGLLEKEVPYKFDTEGKRTPEEEAAEWGVPADQIKSQPNKEDEG